MGRTRLDDKRRRVAALLGEAPAEVVARFARSFDVEYAHNSTAIEGNTLSLIQTKVILEDGLSVGGKALREIYEVANHDRAFSYVKRAVAEGRLLDEEMLKDIHALLMENIMVGGVYRNVEVRITGAGFRPPAPQEMFQQMRWFFTDMPRQREKLNAIEWAAWTHAEFVRIHPFPDGNGRTARMLMNLQLLTEGYQPISIAKEERLAYYEALEAYAVGGDLAPFAEMVAALEEARLDEYLAAFAGA